MASKWLHCKQEDSTDNTTTTTHFQNFFSLVPPRGSDRRLLATDHCYAKAKVPLLSITVVDHFHIFIFVLAVAHVSFSALTIRFGGVKISQWKDWEDSIAKINTIQR
ncbi:Mlo domain-containing protein, partial [Cephalotus follicularis]